MRTPACLTVAVAVALSISVTAPAGATAITAPGNASAACFTPPIGTDKGSLTTHLPSGRSAGWATGSREWR